MQGFWFAGAMLIGCCALADSQQPAPRGSTDANNQQVIGSAHNQSGDKSNPIADHAAPALSHQEDKNQMGAGRSSDSPNNDRWITAATIASAFFSLLTVLVMLRQTNINKTQADLTDAQNKIMEEQTSLIKTQAKLMDETLKETERSNKEQGGLTRDEIKRADAAESYRDLRAKEDQKIARESAAAATRAADTLPNIERAYVFIVVTHAKTTPQPGVGGTTIECDIRFNNHGRTPAIITKMFAGGTHGTIPPQTLINCREADISPGLVIGSGGDYPSAYRIHLLPSDYTQVTTGESLCFCYGMVEYKDVFGNERKTGFCWQWGKRTSYKFLISPNTPLNHYN
ncbi:MAG: hypothetical protein JWR07_3206 [Nevskia sp.]|nr:hypothetical protein [Nevskia sp.]